MANGGNGPMEVVDTVAGGILHLPLLPARIVQGIGQGIAGMGGDMAAGVQKGFGARGDPGQLAAGALDYVLAVPKGVLSVLKGALDGVTGTVDSLSNRLSR